MAVRTFNSIPRIVTACYRFRKFPSLEVIWHTKPTSYWIVQYGCETWFIIMRNTTNKCIYRYGNSFDYKQCGLLHVSTNYCGHLQGGVLWRIYCIERWNKWIYGYKISCQRNLTYYICKLNCFNAVCNIAFIEHLPEDGHNSWPKHVAGYAVYNKINLHICVSTGFSRFSWLITSAWSEII